MTLILQPPHLQALQAHAEQTYPEECCGLLLGRYEAETDRARQKQAGEIAHMNERLQRRPQPVFAAERGGHEPERHGDGRRRSQTHDQMTDGP